LPEARKDLRSLSLPLNWIETANCLAGSQTEFGIQKLDT
jgi:hypothetical protein